ncbi:MAG: DUF368 domain-containing protein [Mycoplasma sp.]|nr:DUF368 domain-containing protein [Mycoplasma sp.]
MRINSNKDNENEKYNKTLDVDSFKNATGLELVYKLAKWSSIGVFMGVSDAVPGYSGGTTLSLLGVYSRIILIAKSVIKPEPGITRTRAFLWMVPFVLGWVLGVFGFAKLTEFMVNNHYGLELMFLFGSFVLTSIPIFIKGEKPQIGIEPREHKNDDWKTKLIVFVEAKKRNRIWYRRITAIFGFLLILGLSIWAYFKGGIDFDAHNSSSDKKIPLNFETIFPFVLVSYAAGTITIVPGGSGAIIQLIFNQYKNIHWKALANIHLNIIPMLLFAVFTFLGMLTSVFTLAWLLKNHHSFLASLSLGMLCASIISIFLVPETSIWKHIFEKKHIFGVIGFSIIGILSGVLITIKINRGIKRKEAQIREIKEKELKKRSLNNEQ